MKLSAAKRSEGNHMSVCASTRQKGLFSFLLPKPVEEHLLDRLVVGHHHVADGVPTDKVADFFGKVFGVISSALQRLRHEDDLQTGLALHVLGIFNVTKKNKVAEPVHFSVGTEYFYCLSQVAVRKRQSNVAQHLLEHR